MKSPSSPRVSPLAAVVLLPLLLLGALVHAAPHDRIQLQYSQSHAYERSSLRKGGRPWARLRDWVVDSIWPLKTTATLSAPAVKGHPTTRMYDDLVLRFNVSTPDQVASLAKASETLFLDVWGYTDGHVDIRLPSDNVGSLLQLLPTSLHSAHSLLMSPADLANAVRQTYIDTSRPPNPPASGFGTTSFSLELEEPRDFVPNVFFEEYRTLTIIQPWMRLLSSLFSSHVKVISIGTSFEGRDILAFKVGVHPTNDEQPVRPRKTIVVSGGVHAREWISITTVNYIAYSFITSYGKAGEVTRLLEDFDWIFIPTLNPDGYVYSWDFDRLWRKNRQRTPLRFCPGIDLDRSFGFMWDRKSTEDTPCSESYAGEEAFHGAEAKQFALWAKNQTENGNVEFAGLIDLHSYSQQILYPYSYSCTEEPPTLEDLEELGAGLAKAIRLNQHHIYKVVPACEGNVFSEDSKMYAALENGGGSLLDWFYHEMGVRNAYQIKLPDTGSYGFLLPRKFIVPTGEELFQAVKYFGVSLTSSFNSKAGDDNINADFSGHQQQKPIS